MILNGVFAKVSAINDSCVSGASDPSKQKSIEPSNKSLSKASEPASLVSNYR